MITALCLLLSASLAFTPAPSDALRAKMILMEVAQHGAIDRSVGVNDHGQCKKFQADIFSEAAKGFGLSSSPDVSLYLPIDHADVEVSGRPVGTCWDMPAASAGNPFVEAARFDYDQKLSQEENQAIAAEFLQNARAGDILQMLARYTSGGRGTHTLMFTQPYDPRLTVLHWADSNFANRLIDGVRYGIVRAYQCWDFQEVAGWLASDWHNGATLYRLRDDVVRQ